MIVEIKKIEHTHFEMATTSDRNIAYRTVVSCAGKLQATTGSVRTGPPVNNKDENHTTNRNIGLNNISTHCTEYKVFDGILYPTTKKNIITDSTTIDQQGYRYWHHNHWPVKISSLTTQPLTSMVSLLTPQLLDILTGSRTIDQQRCPYLRHNYWAARGALLTP